MTGPPLPAGLGFSLAVPSTWWELDVDPATRTSSLERLVEQQVRDVPELRPHRTALGRLLREQAQHAWDAGASYCATLVDPTEEGPVTASAVVLVVPAPVRTDDRDPVSLVLSAFSPITQTEPEGPWCSTDVVDVDGAGRAGRAWGIEDVELPDGAGAVRVVVLRTLVPLPDLGRTLVLTCSSPVLPLAEDLLDLFDAISSTLQVGAPA